MHDQRREVVGRLVPDPVHRRPSGPISPRSRVSAELLHRGPAYPRLGVLARDLGDEIALAGGKAKHRFGPDGGIVMLPFGLAADCGR
jgi:hypothetical protein